MLTTDERLEIDAIWRERQNVLKEELVLIRLLEGTPSKGIEVPLMKALTSLGYHIVKLYELAHPSSSPIDADEIAENVRLTQFNGLGL